MQFDPVALDAAVAASMAKQAPPDEMGQFRQEVRDRLTRIETLLGLSALPPGAADAAPMKTLLERVQAIEDCKHTFGADVEVHVVAHVLAQTIRALHATFGEGKIEGLPILDHAKQ